MSAKMTRAEFLRVSLLGVAGAAAAGVLPAGAARRLSAFGGQGEAESFHPAWSSSMAPDFSPRLSAHTRALAAEGLSGKWGRELSGFSGDVSGILASGEGVQTKYGRIAVKVAQTAPLKLLPGELLVGFATFEEASRALVPGLGTPGINHTTFGFERALRLGYKGLKEEVLQRQRAGGLDAEGEDLLQGMLLCIEAAGIWNERYVKALKEALPKAAPQEAAVIARNTGILEWTPYNPPRDFREALQCLWSMWEFHRLLGNWSGLGRVDKILGPYLKKDLSEGKITLEEAREELAHFWIKGTGWVTGLPTNSGDAQFYQNVVLAGIDSSGREVANEVTYLILDVVEELHISDFPIAVRINASTPEKLLRRVAQVQRLGGGIVSLYNEDVVIEALAKFGYPLAEAREFTNDGCWEPIIPGKTAFTYSPKDMVAVMNLALGTDSSGEVPDYKTFDALYAAFLAALRADVEAVQLELDSACTAPWLPCALASLFTEGCVERGRCYENRGPKYSVRGIHYGGLADVANSLLVIKKLVYQERFLSLAEFVGILRSNWEGKEALRQLIRTRFVFFGNDDAEADAMAARVFDDYAALVNEVKERKGILRHCTLSTFGREVDWKDMRAATAQGSRRGDILATNCSPTPGTDKKGPTAAMNSYCKLDFSKMPDGATLELKILPQSVKGEAGLKALMALAKTFRRQGGYYVHIDVVDSAVLIDAQLHPEKYPNLPVRVSGWSARFTTLSKDWQDMIIQRTQQLA